MIYELHLINRPIQKCMKFCPFITPSSQQFVWGLQLTKDNKHDANIVENSQELPRQITVHLDTKVTLASQLLGN